MDELDEEVLQLFVDESREHLAGIEGDLLAMEAMTVLDKELVNKVFRTLHTIKGGAGFFDLSKLQNLAHAMENVLDLIRNGELVTTPLIVSSLLAGADTVAGMVNNLTTSNDQDISAHLQVFEQILEGDSHIAASTGEVETNSQAGARELFVPVERQVEDDGRDNEHIPEEVRPTGSEGDLPEAPAAVMSAEQLSPVAQASASKPDGNKPDTGKTAQVADQSIRVQLPLLDRLMELAGELVLTRNALLQSVESKDGASLAMAAKKVDSITSQLQKAIMSTRMQSIDIVFSKFRRIVRDLSGQLGKDIRLEITGEEVELDKKIIEALGDPLTHLVRNAVDHGLEKPAIRRAAGKSEEGFLRIDAFHEAGQVVIEISDDGAGINPAVIAAKAVEKQICTEEDIARLTDNDIIRLIFQPGFTTAAEVTDISGRGVGMDVVRQNLAKVGGVADIESVLGKGSTVRLKLPLTLAIIPSVLVGISSESFAIPQVNVVEMVGITPAEVKNRIQRVGGATVLRLRGELLPLIDLSQHLGIEEVYVDPVSGETAAERRDRLFDRRMLAEEGEIEIEDPRHVAERRQNHQSAVNIVVVAAGVFKYGIRVDELHESAEIVVKPLGMHFKDSDEFTGATILGDGKVALILNAEGVRRLTGANETRQSLEELDKVVAKVVESDSCMLLVVKNGPEEMYAVPLQLVARIERFAYSDMQEVGGKKAISYRGGILPLVSLEGTVSDKAPQKSAAKEFYAVVFAVGKGEVGLIVPGIKDIVNYTKAIDVNTHRRKGISGSLIVDGAIIQLLDLFGLLEIVDPQWTGHLIRGEIDEEDRLTILLVEDSQFFQKQIADEIVSAGFTVIIAGDGLQGIEQLNNNPQVCMVVADIEMPNMDGIEMVKTIRAHAEYRSLPIIALTSVAGAEAEKRGYEAGVNEYHIKLDREQVVASCVRLASKRPEGIALPQIVVGERS